MIYLIVCEETNTCKIGYSLNPQSRLKGVQTGNPFKLSLNYVIRGSIKDEKALHNKFCEYSISREWFSCSDDILSYFESQSKITKADEVDTTSEYDERNQRIFIGDLSNRELMEYYRFRCSFKAMGKPFNMRLGAYYAKESIKNKYKKTK